MRFNSQVTDTDPTATTGRLSGLIAVLVVMFVLGSLPVAAGTTDEKLGALRERAEAACGAAAYIASNVLLMRSDGASDKGIEDAVGPLVAKVTERADRENLVSVLTAESVKTAYETALQHTGSTESGLAAVLPTCRRIWNSAIPGLGLEIPPQ